MVLKIAVIGNDFNSVHPVFTRIPEALEEASLHINKPIELHSFSTESFRGSADRLKSYAGIFVAPSPFQNLKGLYECARFSRENNRPWLSVCGGTQYAMIEFGMNVLKLKNPGHVEHDPDCTLKMVSFLPDHYRVSNDGPLQSFQIYIREGTRSETIYSTLVTHELFFANYMLDPSYYRPASAAGLILSGTFDDQVTPCLIELENHPFFIGALFQPQMNSAPGTPHPLICEFLAAAAKTQGLA